MSKERRENARTHWRGLHEPTDTPELRAILEREFPAQADELKDTHSRRAFLQLMGSSLAMMGLVGCHWPERKLLPFASRPVHRVPGMPAQFATAMELNGAAQGLLVTSYDGRPIKIEGNPRHPLNGTPGQPDPGGTADIFAQASVLELYDPDRSQSLLRRDGRQWFRPTWDEFQDFAAGHFGALRDRGGQGLRVLSEVSASPTFHSMRDGFRRIFPQAGWHEYEPLARDQEILGASLAFGRPIRSHWNLRDARVIVSLDSDFLQSHPSALRHARDFAAARNPDRGEMSRLHVVESAYTITGGKADHRYPVPAGAVSVVAVRLAGEVMTLLGNNATAVVGSGAVGSGAGGPGAGGLGAGGLGAGDLGAGDLGAGDPVSGDPVSLSLGAGVVQAMLQAAGRNHQVSPATPFVAQMARDLLSTRGSCLVVAGPRQPAVVHALTHALNAALGNVGRTVSYTEEPGWNQSAPAGSIHDLAAAIRDGQVETLLILGGNPVYTAPVDLDFVHLISRIPTSLHLSPYQDETTHACTWHLPRAHYLESWDDTRAWDGTVSVVQPLIEPLYDGKTPSELLALVMGDSTLKGYDLVRRTQQAAAVGVDFEPFWREALESGVVRGSAFVEVKPTLRPEGLMQAFSSLEPRALDLGRENLEILFCPDMSVYDGRFANNGWLQEVPDALTKLTWDNAVLLSPATAAALGVKADDLVILRYRGRELKMAVYVMPGQAPFSAAVALGYGRTHAGRTGNGSGFDVYRLRTSEAPHFDTGLTIVKTTETYPLACTQEHHRMDRIGRQGMAERVPVLVREGTSTEYRADPRFVREHDHHPPLVSLWKEHKYAGHRWGMTLDLTACTGCNACIVACAAENNVPVVGKKRVAEGREMQWIRVDRYFIGDPEAPEVAFQPMACAHCENAPCEQVCPVGATVHDRDGLNVMVYNRCIGTRYCSNNCPFKVRRFNFFNYRKGLATQQKMAYNPEVTVRSRGVMEKCTYCLQRIEAAKIAAKNERRPIRDSEIIPACAQTCPSGAIVFGDLNDPESRVAKLRALPRSYALLEELNIKPRTQYLARLRNPVGREQHDG
jgi:molybdopterin-containing oxidoreductase family iron-sulfur binding subunit